MQIRLALHNESELDQLLADQQNPASARYHQWLKSGDFSRRFGPTGSEVKALEAWLQSEGFTITSGEPGSVKFRGNIGQAQQTFDVRIARFADGSVYANTSDPVVPQRFAAVIGAVLGMDNMVHAVPATHQPALSAPGSPAGLSVPAQPRTQIAQAERDSSEGSEAAPIGGAIINGAEAFGPGDVRTFYDETVGFGHDGTGDCIAIVGISDFLDSAMTAFTNQFGLPAISYTRKLHGASPGINNAGEAEAELDLQWAHAAAPGALVVYHLGSDLVADISGAVTDNACGAISISYAFCAPTASLVNNTLDPLFKQAAAQGQSVFVSSGDNGAAGLGSSCAAGSSKSVNEMSADPNVTSVGGTQFTPTYSGGNDVGRVTEKVWNDGSGSTGGGASKFFSKPGYQTGAGVPNDGARDVPDIALIASPNSPGVFWGHDVGGTGAISCCIGGTSLAAPLWAGFSRVIAQLAGSTRLGSFNPLIYGLANSQYSAAGFHDVTVGNNNFNGVTGFNAGPGYDQTTGWGTVDFNTFANAAKSWIAGSATPTATSTGTPTATPTTTATATPAATATPTPTAVATQTSTATTNATTTPTTISTAIATATAIGTVTSTVTATPTPIQTAMPTATITATVVMTPTSTRTFTPTATPTPISEPSGGTLSVPAAVRFPTVGIGMPTTTRTVQITNRSLASTLTLDVGGLPLPFEVFGAGHYSLSPDTSVPVTIAFTPETIGTANQTLSIRSGDPRHPYVNVKVSGTVQAGKLSAPAKVALAGSSGSTTTKTVTLRNSGKGMLSGTVQPFVQGSPLTLIGGPVSFALAPGQTQPITIQFAPASRDKISANLAIETTPPPGTTTIVVTGSVR